MKLFYVKDKDKHIIYATYMKESIEDFYLEYPALRNNTLIECEEISENDPEKSANSELTKTNNRLQI